jgi:hypothetical protein
MMKKKIFTIGLFVLFLSISAGSAVAALSEQDIGKLVNAGLTDKTVKALTDLHQDTDRQRSPEMTVDAALKMVREGFPDGLIRLMADLDRNTGKRPAMPITPNLLLELTERGTSMDSIWLLATSELARASGPVAEGDKTYVPPSTTQPQQAPEPTTEPKTEPVAPPTTPTPPSDPEGPVLGRFPTKDAEGRRIIVHKSGNVNGLSTKVTRDAEGRRVYRYGVRSSGPAQLDQSQEDAVLKALQLFGILNIQICR